MAVMDDKGMQDWVADHDGEGDDGGKRCQRQQSGNDGCEGRRQRRQTTVTTADGNGGGQ
jgi:hypothetical protein